MIAFYITLTVISFLTTIIYFYVWHNHFSILMTVFYILTPITNLGFLIVALSTNIEMAIVGTILTYIGGCYLILIIMLLVFYFCKVPINKYVRIGLMILYNGIIRGKPYLIRREYYIP